MNESKWTVYYVFDTPIPYKNLLIHPVRLKDYLLFSAVAQCLMLEKNSIKDPVLAVKAISQTYLEYLFSSSRSSEGRGLVQLLAGLLALVLGKKDDTNFEINYGMNSEGKPFFKIDNEFYYSDDFDVLRKMIAEQNALELPDETIQKDVREKMEEARRFKEKINKSKQASIEEQITALALYTGWELEKIYDLTIRKFLMAIKRSNHMIMSNIYLTASTSGFVTFKDKTVLKGWLADLTEEMKNSDVTVSLDSVQNKLNYGDATSK